MKNQKIIPFRNFSVSAKDENNVTYISIGLCQLEQWMKQNKAEYTGDYIEGCLLDNFVLCTDRGFAAVYENYLNANSSDYYIEFQPFPAQEVWKEWYKFEEQNESEIA